MDHEEFMDFYSQMPLKFAEFFEENAGPKPEAFLGCMLTLVLESIFVLAPSKEHAQNLINISFDDAKKRAKRHLKYLESQYELPE